MTGDLRCAFGETGEGWTGPHHCARCAAEVEAACARFAEAQARGEFDAEGYTPNERKAQRKRKLAGGVDPDTGASRSAPVPEPTNPIVKPGKPGDRPDQGLPGRPGGPKPDQELPEVEPPDTAQPKK